MLWYASMLHKQKEETFDSDINMTEYLASFINHAAVRQIKDARENTKAVSDEDFDQILRNKFGRDLSPNAIESGTRADIEETAPVKKVIKKKGSISINDIVSNTGLSLDDIKFIPNSNIDQKK